MTTALVMAGGRSERMRATQGPQHKALIPVLGIPLLERNLCMLLSAGFRDLVVAVSAREDSVYRFVETRGRELARAWSARLDCFREKSPMGTIGVAGLLRDRAETVLVVNVDNLTTLDLQAFVRYHREVQAAMTIAAHVESFRMPFGELVLHDGLVTAYREKPEWPVRISSGTYVLGRRSFPFIPDDQRTDIPGLCTRLIQAGETVAAYEHDSLWIDVNDAASLGRAEQLMAEYAAAFECPPHPPKHVDA